VDLAPVEEALARVARHGGDAAAVLVHVRVVVVGQAAEVEALERAGGHAAVAGREQRLGVRQRRAEVPALPAERGCDLGHRRHPRREPAVEPP
jgi:hypothetical protein